MISVIMPVWVTDDNLYELTKNALASLGTGFELVIVDNGSTIGADQFLGVSDIYIRNKENLGYPKAVNQGLKLSNGDLIAVVNNDIRISPNWIESTQDIFEKTERLGSLHFKMVGYDEPFGLGVTMWETGKERWCTGSFFVWNRQAIEAIGGMDEAYGLGGYDDWDWHHRMNHILDWKSAYTNGVSYQHKDSSTQLLRVPEERSETDKKNRKYFKKNFGKYPEEIWEEKYPEQMKVPWRPFP
jgi:GT2 family glycosyltransferase